MSGCVQTSMVSRIKRTMDALQSSLQIVLLCLWCDGPPPRFRRSKILLISLSPEALVLSEGGLRGEIARTSQENSAPPPFGGYPLKLPVLSLTSIDSRKSITYGVRHGAFDTMPSWYRWMQQKRILDGIMLTILLHV